MRIFIPILIFVLFCFVNPLAGNAQQGYSPGYVILSNNDTLSGFLKEQSSRKASQAAIFRKEIKGTKEVYTPNQIKAYRYNEGKYYVSLLARIDSVQKQVFMEYLIKGKANVYYFKGLNSKHYYIQKEAGEIIELTESKEYRQINGTRYLLPPKYKSKLTAILSDADVKPSIQKTSLEYKSLISLAKEYHEKVCDTEACVVYARKRNKIIREYSVFAGASFNRYNFGSQLITDYAQGLQAGILVSFKGIFFSNEKLGLSIGAFLEKDFSSTLRPYDENEQDYLAVDYKDERYYLRSESDFSTVQTKLDVNLDVTSLRIPITVNYYQSIKRSTFIFGLGVSNRITLNSNKDLQIKTFQYQYGKTFKPYFIGPTAFIGYQSKISSSHKITFNLAWDYVADVNSINQDVRLSITQFTGRIGFTF